MKLTILGAGDFGTALGGILAEKGYEVSYYDPKVFPDVSLKDAYKDAEFLVLAVPSFAVSEILPELPTNLPLIITTKGLLSKDSFAHFKDVMALSGPGFAADIKARTSTILTATDARIVELFETDYLSFDLTSDFYGVLLCGALKNVYAVLAGLLGLEKNSSNWEIFIQEVWAEMREILAANGADPATVDLSCGIGDLKLTCGLPSRNYEFGQILRCEPGAKPEKTVEGVSVLSNIRAGEIAVPDPAVKLRQLIEVSRAWS